MESDNDLIIRIRQGDVQAYGTLVERYETVVFAAVVSLVRNRHAAEDVAQEAFVSAYLKLGSLRDGSRFAAWVLQIARRQARGYLLKCRRRQEEALACEMRASGDGEFLSEDRQYLLRKVQRLSASEQVVIALKYFGGHTAEQIAEMQGGSSGTISKRLTRALERLRRWMTKENR